MEESGHGVVVAASTSTVGDQNNIKSQEVDNNNNANHDDTQKQQQEHHINNNSNCYPRGTMPTTNTIVVKIYATKTTIMKKKKNHCGTSHIKNFVLHYQLHIVYMNRIL